MTVYIRHTARFIENLIKIKQDYSFNDSSFKLKNNKKNPDD